MDANAPEIVEAVARKLAATDTNWDDLPWEQIPGRCQNIFRNLATAAIAAARPLILEEAAKVMENLAFFTPVEELVGMTKQEMSVRTCHEGAAAIRSLSKDGEGLDDHRG